MSELTALLDANVLYSAQIRDITLQLARDNLYRARWTSAIQDEWTKALLKRSPHISRKSLFRTRRKMDNSFRGALLSGYEHLIDDLELPDPDDHHVLAAAIWGRCHVLVTQNTRHFPRETLEPYAVQVQHPDEFLAQLMLSRTVQFCSSVRRVLARLSNPPYSAEEYLANLELSGLHLTSSELKRYIHLLA